MAVCASTETTHAHALIGKSTFLKRDKHVHAHAHHRSLIQCLALIRSAINVASVLRGQLPIDDGSDDRANFYLLEQVG